METKSNIIMSIIVVICIICTIIGIKVYNKGGYETARIVVVERNELSNEESINTYELNKGDVFKAGSYLLNTYAQLDYSTENSAKLILDTEVVAGNTRTEAIKVYKGDATKIYTPMSNGKVYSEIYYEEDYIRLNGKIKEEREIDTMKCTINEKEYTINLEKNDTVERLIEMLPLDLTLKEYNGNEKYCYLDESLPTNIENVGHIEAGDVMLFGSDCFVIFYDSFDTTYSYTRIGHIDNLENLGKMNISVKLQK